MAYRRNAGYSTREMARQRRKSAVWIAILGMAILFAAFFISQNPKVLGIGAGGVFALLIFMRVFGNIVEGQVDRKLKLEKRAIRGARGEERVGALLAELPPDEYCVLNDIESPYGNIDHIVIGKNSGIFLLETKAHGGRVEMDGETLLVNRRLPEKDFVGQALRNAYWLREKASGIVGAQPWITPVLVFTNAFVSHVRPIKGVHVMNKKYLLPMLHGTTKPNPLTARIWEMREEIQRELS